MLSAFVDLAFILMLKDKVQPKLYLAKSAWQTYHACQIKDERAS
jgi:hypothetical protein